MEGPRTTLIRDNLTNMNAVNLSAGLASQVKKLKERFALERVVLVGLACMITEARIEEVLKPAGLDWITTLRAPAIRSPRRGRQPATVLVRRARSRHHQPPIQHASDVGTTSPKAETAPRVGESRGRSLPHHQPNNHPGEHSHNHIAGEYKR
jgi:hypothetical protein